MSRDKGSLVGVANREVIGKEGSSLILRKKLNCSPCACTGGSIVCFND